MHNINTDELIEALCQIGHDKDSNEEIIELEEKFNCEINREIEKHNVLQYTYFYEIDFGIGEIFYAEIESGINNGTQVNHQDWGSSTFSRTKTIEVLKDFVLDTAFYKKGSIEERKAAAFLSANKDKLFDYHRKCSYDNYITGSDSGLKLDPIFKQLHFIAIYEIEQVYCNII